LEGRAKIVVVSAEGKEAVIGTISENDFFGEQCLNGQIKRIASTIALADCVTVRAPKAGFVALLHVEPEFSEFFITYLLSRSARTEDDLIDHLFNSSEKRLARLLLILSNFGKDAPPEPVLETISQETLAQMIGTTRSRVNTFMNKFRRLGFIDYNGGVQVRRSLLNVVLRD
jgi:CRP-like cAMP-binding protein